ncbi:MAG: ATP-binding protein [Ktedonobacteraceae bacterium]
MTHSTETTHKAMCAALEAVHGLTLLRDVLDDATGQAVLALFRVLIAPEPDASSIAQAYSHAFAALALTANTEELLLDVPDAWQAYLVSCIVDSVNPWSTQAERATPHSIASGLHEQAKRDLYALRLLYDIHAQSVWELTRNLVTQSLPSLHDAWVPWYNLTLEHTEAVTARQKLKQQLARTQDWTTSLPLLEQHWGVHGTGMFARYAVLRWQGHTEGLHGITYPDSIQLSNLIGYEREKARLQTNLERFVHGLLAHDAVLYGAPGTGKSSTVKALANAYAHKGLRLIEVRKEFVNDLPTIVQQVRGHAPHFLLFIDDLSFEEHETDYKALKVLLEGAVEARPANVLIYATSNRLNLIRENFADRGKPTDDVHWRDTLDEKAALVARFGLRVTFMTPDQAQYLNIVTELAQQRGLTLAEEDLRMRALAWERQHTGRSGRLARQFIDELEAEQRMSIQVLTKD